MNKYSGFVDPSLYVVIINAEECGWVPRPPSIPLTTSQEVISQLKKSSSHVSSKGELDLRFAASLHERKHFLDLHLSSCLWQSFLSWFHCSSQIFSIVSLLKRKKINIPLYTPMGSLRVDNPFNRQEQEIIDKICSRIFTNPLHLRLKYALEISASLLQYSFLRDQYQIDQNVDSKSLRYYKSFFQKPLQEFSGSISRAFSCYTFLSWFCTDYDECKKVETLFQAKTDCKSLAYSLLSNEYFARKQDELNRDVSFLETFVKHFNKPETIHFPDLSKHLSELVSFRKDLFSSIDHMIELLTNVNYFSNWLVKEAIKTFYLVDFGKPLSPDTEITENYHASKWIVQNQQFLYYDDQQGKQVLDMNELDNLINIQLLSSFLVSPIKLFPFKTKIANKEFLECDIIEYDEYNEYN